VNKVTSYLLLQNLKGWSPAQFEHLCAYLHFCPTGWAAYDEQYRLRKARYPHTPWGDIDMELWLLHVSTPAKYAHFDNTNVSHMYVGNCCDFWLCDRQLTTLYGQVAAKLSQLRALGPTLGGHTNQYIPLPKFFP
jgi:hypothetical protein